MRINKKKLLFMLTFVFLFAMLFATSAFALKDEAITVTYKTSVGLNHTYGTVNAKGGVAFNLEKAGDFPADKTEEMGYSYIWVSEDGQAYEAGSKVVFYENTSLTPVLAYDISSFEELLDYCSKFDDSHLTTEDFKSMPENGITIRLLEDITITKALEHKTTLGAVMNFVLNGQTLTINKSLDGALGGERFGTRFYGSGTVKYEGSGALVRLNSNSTGGSFNLLEIGAGVYLDAPNATLGKDTSANYSSGYPNVKIYGIVNCKNILEVTDKANRNSSIGIYSPAFITLGGELLVKGSTDNTISVIIQGGTVVTTNSGAAFINQSNSYNVSGGSFLFAKASDYSDIKSYLASGCKSYTKFTCNGKTYTTVLKSACNTANKFTNEKYEASCANATQEVYKCGTCSTVHYISYGTPKNHKYDSNVEKINATPTSRGMMIKSCTICACKDYEFFMYDPSDVLVQILVLANGEKLPLNVKVKDLFNIDNNYVITSIKDFTLGKTTYTASQIEEIIIPAGIKGLNISSDNTGLKKLVFDAQVDLEVVSLAKLTALETIELRSVTHVKFLANCAPNSLKTIKSDKTKSKITFGDNAFSGMTNLQELVMCGLSEYSFGASSFKGTGIKKLSFVDNATYKFTGEGAFLEAKAEELYIGRGTKAIDKKTFISMPNLGKIILMEVNSLADGEFSSLKSGCAVYHHASSLALGEKTFEKNSNITVYTTAEITKGFAETTYTIVKNIKHAYHLDKKDSTCTETGYMKYITDCPCGENEGTKTTVYKNVYTNATGETGADYTDKSISTVPHNPSVGTVIRYVNGYTKSGTYAKECTMCKELIQSTAKACDPLVRSIGYSVSEDASGNGSMTVRYVLNVDVFKEYAQTYGNKFEYGTVFAAKKLLNDKTPLKSSGAAESGAYKVKAIASNNVASYTLKVANLNDAQKELEFVMCVYIIEDGKISYIQDNEIVTNPSGVSFKEVKELADYKDMMRAS